MAKFSYQPKGVCSVQIDFEVEDGIVRNVHFTRGCNGNTQGISALVEGMNIDDVISRLKGTNCNGRGTSCPDQLAIASVSYTHLSPLQICEENEFETEEVPDIINAELAKEITGCLLYTSRCV